MQPGGVNSFLSKGHIFFSGYPARACHGRPSFSALASHHQRRNQVFPLGDFTGPAPAGLNVMKRAQNASDGRPSPHASGSAFLRRVPSGTMPTARPERQSHFPFLPPYPAMPPPRMERQTRACQKSLTFKRGFYTVP